MCIRDSWYEVFKQINVFRKIAPDAPFIFVANKRDLPKALPLEEIKKKLKLPPISSCWSALPPMKIAFFRCWRRPSKRWRTVPITPRGKRINS